MDELKLDLQMHITELASLSLLEEEEFIFPSTKQIHIMKI